MIRQKSPAAPVSGVPVAPWRGYNRRMNKAFVKESDNDDDEEAAALALAIPAGAKNYITPAGYQRIKEELLQLIDVDRPEVVRIVHWAASNGDRSENGDYIYGKRRLREIDRNSSSCSPCGVLRVMRSPSRALVMVRAIGETQLILPFRGSNSSMQTMVMVCVAPSLVR